MPFNIYHFFIFYLYFCHKYFLFVVLDEDMQSHGSVITHLLSQVKIGMDLTKVMIN